MERKKSPQGKCQVMNVTDGILASPSKMTKQEADNFIQTFRARYKDQGYYLTANGDRIKPEDVVLECIW